jgi:hypothetical protein
MTRSCVLVGVVAILVCLLTTAAWATFVDGPLKIRSIPISARPGDRILIGIRTTPKAHCTIEVHGQGFLQDVALQPQVADKTGLADWTFELSKNYKADRLPIIVTSTSGADVDRKIVTAIPIVGVRNSSCPLRFELEPVKAMRGQEILLTVKAVPGEALSLEAQDAGPAFVPGEQFADRAGRATWKFKLARDYKADVLPVVITGRLMNCQRKLIGAIPVRRPM